VVGPLTRPRWLAALCITLAAGVFAIDVTTPSDLVEGELYLPVIALSFWAPQAKWILRAAGIGTTLTLLAYLVAPAAGFAWPTVAQAVTVVIAQWAVAYAVYTRRWVAIDRAEAVRDLGHDSAAGESRAGLIPICAYCRRVRDAAGFWKPIEKYITEQTHADFTHGICPHCMRGKLYGTLLRQS
jgi:hypothetical protein